MMPVAKLALGGAALWSLILVAATERDPPRPPARVPDPIAARWISEAEALPKADRLTINSQFAADKEPPARSAANGPPPRDVLTPLPAADTDADDLRPPDIRPRSASARQAGVNICIRHGMHKMLTNGGRSWRCRKNSMIKKPRTPRAKKPRSAEQRKRALMRQATSAASDKTNIVGVEKARGRRPRPVTLPAVDQLRKIGIEGEGED